MRGISYKPSKREAHLLFILLDFIILFFYLP